MGLDMYFYKKRLCREGVDMSEEDKIFEKLGWK